MSLKHFIKRLAEIIFISFTLSVSANASICLQGQATGGGASSPAASITFTKPSGSVANDVLLVQVAAHAQSGSAAIDTPSGWTRIREDTSGSLGQFIFYRTLTSADAPITSYTFSIPSWASSARIAGGIMSLRGVNTGGVLENSYGDTSAPVLTTPSGTTAGNIWAIAAFASQNGNNVLTPGSGLTQISAISTGSVPNGVSSLLAYSIQSAAGAVSAKTASGSSATSADALILIQAGSSTPSCGTTLIADYHFDESSWSSVSNEAKDSSGNNLHGTSFAGAQTRSTSPALSGNPGTCNYGDFATSNSQYVNIPHNSKLNFNNTFTAMAWIYIRSYNAGGLRSFLSKDSNYEMHVASDGRLNWWMQGSAGTGDYFSTVTIPLNQWRHVAFRFEIGQQDFFINGARDTAARKTYNGTLTLDTDPLQIGQDQNASGRYWNGYIDEVKLYNGTLSDAAILAASAERHTCPGIDHYQFEFTDNTGLTCANKTITIKACADSSCSTLYSGSTTITPSASNGGTWETVNAFTGSTTATLAKTSAGISTIGISSANPSATYAPQCIVGGVAGSCDIEFKDSGFIWTFPASNMAGSTNFLIANKPVTGITLQAVRTDNTTQTCAPAFVGMRNINLSSNYLSPVSGTLPVSINGNSLASSPTLPLTFDANARTTLTMHYADAGQVRVNANYSGSVATGDNGVSLTGNITAVSRPVGFCVQALTPVTGTPTGVLASCNSSSCALYQRAGQNFPLRVQAKAWEVDGESAGSYCSGNSTTQNFIGSVNLQPDMLDVGVNGSLAQPTITISSAGQNTISNQQFSEVGRFSLLYSSNYFGLTIPSDYSTNIGRIAPDHFNVLINNYNAPCSTFAYGGLGSKVGQTIVIDGNVTARNAQNLVTSNYQGAYANINSSSLNLIDLVAGVNGASGNFSVLPTLSFNSGSANFTPAAESYLFNSSAAPQMVNLRAQINDNDNTVGSTDSLNSIDFRLGRIRLDNAYGPEILPLTIPLRAEYFDGTRYTLNTLDNCSSYINTNATLSAFNGNLSSGETTVTTPNSSTLLQNGVHNSNSPLQLSPPGTGNDGDTTLTLTVPTWLQYDWSNNGSNQNPNAIATFGRYRGSDRIIYWKEKR